MRLTREEYLERAKEILRRAGAAGAEINETTPRLGGLREYDVQMLVNLGIAEWIERGHRARLRVVVDQPTTDENRIIE